MTPKPLGALAVALTLVVLLESPLLSDSRDDWEKMKHITPKSYVCSYATGPIVIDGKITDKAWKNAAWSSEFEDIEGDIKPRPRFSTRMKMLWDDEYLYIAAWMKEPHVWGTLTEHDSVIFHDNDFEVFIDPDGDNHEYYEFEMNALNTGWDLFLLKPYKDGGPADNSWEIPGLKTAVHIDGTLNDPSDKDNYWSVEIAIPWSVLAEYAHQASPPNEGDNWRFNYSRVEWQHLIEDGQYKKLPKTREDNWVWSPQGIIDMHRPERWGYVWFTKKKRAKVGHQLAETHAMRELLMTVYHHQKSYFGKNKSWAETLEQLDITDTPLNRLNESGFNIRLTEQGYVATYTSTLASGKTVSMQINERSRLIRIAEAIK